MMFFADFIFAFFLDREGKLAFMRNAGIVCNFLIQAKCSSFRCIQRGEKSITLWGFMIYQRRINISLLIDSIAKPLVQITQARFKPYSCSVLACTINIIIKQSGFPNLFKIIRLVSRVRICGIGKAGQVGNFICFCPFTTLILRNSYTHISSQSNQASYFSFETNIDISVWITGYKRIMCNTYIISIGPELSTQPMPADLE